MGGYFGTGSAIFGDCNTFRVLVMIKSLTVSQNVGKIGLNFGSAKYVVFAFNYKHYL